MLFLPGGLREGVDDGEPDEPLLLGQLGRDVAYIVLLTYLALVRIFSPIHGQWTTPNNICNSFSLSELFQSSLVEVNQAGAHIHLMS